MKIYGQFDTMGKLLPLPNYIMVLIDFNRIHHVLLCMQPNRHTFTRIAKGYHYTWLLKCKPIIIIYPYYSFTPFQMGESALLSVKVRQLLEPSRVPVGGVKIERDIQRVYSWVYREAGGSHLSQQVHLHRPGLKQY